MKRFLKIILIFIAALVGLLAIFVLAAFIYPKFEKNIFVNQTLVLDNPLIIPPLLQPHIENGEKIFDLNIQAGQTEFFQGKQAKTLGFNGNYLGPTIQAHTGDYIRMHVVNHLTEETTVHWHGMHVPAAMDGGPHQGIEPGQTWQPYWTITNQASTLWYHSHLTGKTGEQIYNGLAGMFIIEDKISDGLNIPKTYGFDDIPLIVQDREFDASGQLVYSFNPNKKFTAGMLGETILVNGTRAPYVEVPAKLVRLRILNASNARRYNFGFDDGHMFYQIGTDGGLLESLVERTNMQLAPGERAEILIDLSNVTKPITLMSFPTVDGTGKVTDTLINFVEKIIVKKTDDHQQFKILELRPKEGTYPKQEIPQILNSISRLKEDDVARTREFILNGVNGFDKINGKQMDGSRVDQVIKRGDIEIWKIRNQSLIYHPFHIHGVQFLVLDRDGKPPPAYERGWKDTVVVNPAETVRVIMQFTDYSDPTLPYMFHCHILEHEDMGMMGQFVVVDDPIQKVQTQPIPNMPVMK